MQWLSFAVVLPLALTFVSPATYAQARGGAPPGVASTPQPPDASTRPDSIQDSGLYGYWTAMTNQGRAGGALWGKVNIEGEPLLWEPVMVSIVCRGKVANTTPTNPKGNFAFTSMPGTMNNVDTDVERRMQVQYEGCDVRASLPGFQSDPITITQKNLRDDPDLGTINLRPDHADAGTAISGTTTEAPKKATEQFEKAYAAMMGHDPARAESDLEKATKIDPKFAEAWYQLGKLQMTRKDPAAEQSFSKAVEADPQFVPPYEELSALAFAGQKWPEVLVNANKVEQLNPTGDARIWYFDALANYQLGHADAAKQSAEKSLALDPRHTILNTEQLLAVILAGQGDYAGALDHLRNCATYFPKGPNADLVQQQIAQLEQAAERKK